MKKGFTVLEIMISITIMICIIAISLPNYSNFKKYGEKKSAIALGGEICSIASNLYIENKNISKEELCSEINNLSNANLNKNDIEVYVKENIKYIKIRYKINKKYYTCDMDLRTFKWNVD